MDPAVLALIQKNKGTQSRRDAGGSGSPASRASGEEQPKSVAEQAARTVLDNGNPETLKRFISELVKALMRTGASAATQMTLIKCYGEDALNTKVALAAMNVLSDYESEDDSHLFPQQQPLVDTPAE